MKRPSFAVMMGAGLLCLAALSAFFVVRARRAPHLAPTRVLELAQSVGLDFTAPLEALVAPYAASHPETKIVVRYEPYPKDGLRVRDAHVALRPLASEADGVPLFAGGYVLLAYNRTLSRTAPATWPELVTKAQEVRREGKVSFGVALPEEAYTLLPFFGEALLGEGERREEPTREAFSFLFDLRFTSGLVPHMCPSECAVRLFREGRTPFLLTGEWRLPELRAALGEDLGLARVPALPAAGTPLRSVRTLFGLVRASDAEGEARTASDALVAYLGNEGRDRLLEVAGKVPYPLRLERDPKRAGSEREAELAALVQEGTVAASAEAIHGAVERLSPVWDRFAAGGIGPNEAARRLLAASR